MAQNKNSRKSEGLCQKIHNAVSPFRSRIRRISHEPHEKQISKANKNPVRISSQTKPVHVLHQPSPGKMVPVEDGPPTAPFSAQNAKKLITLSAGKETSAGKTVQESADREILIVRGQRFAKSASSRIKGLATPGKIEKVSPNEEKSPNHVQYAKARSKKDDHHDTSHESKFSDYISKVKNRLMRTASNVGGGVEKSLSFK